MIDLEKELESVEVKMPPNPKNNMAVALESYADKIRRTGMSKQIYDEVHGITPEAMLSINPATLTINPSRTKQRVALESINDTLKKVGGGLLVGLGVGLILKLFELLSNSSSSGGGGSVSATVTSCEATFKTVQKADVEEGKFTDVKGGNLSKNIERELDKFASDSNVVKATILKLASLVDDEDFTEKEFLEIVKEIRSSNYKKYEMLLPLLIRSSGVPGIITLPILSDTVVPASKMIEVGLELIEEVLIYLYIGPEFTLNESTDPNKLEEWGEKTKNILGKYASKEPPESEKIKKFFYDYINDLDFKDNVTIVSKSIVAFGQGSVNRIEPKNVVDALVNITKAPSSLDALESSLDKSSKKANELMNKYNLKEADWLVNNDLPPTAIKLLIESVTPASVEMTNSLKYLLRIIRLYTKYIKAIKTTMSKAESELSKIKRKLDK